MKREKLTTQIIIIAEGAGKAQVQRLMEAIGDLPAAVIRVASDAKRKEQIWQRHRFASTRRGFPPLRGM